ncbi:MAG: hypothetical protein IPK33_08305 [Gemmatimonadetes bacterium]|nr:hypothetical protein [Gemmatimonadota bacterium]
METTRYCTNNLAKFLHLSRLLRSGCRISITHMLPPMLWEEGDDAAENARLKAIIGSRATREFILASDESVRIAGVTEECQPRARIRRCVADDATDIEVASYYSKLLWSLPESARTAHLVTHFALARCGEVVGEVAITSVLELRVPAYERFIPRRPLSAFHYVQEFSKYYVELADEEMPQEDRALQSAACQFLRSLVT